MNKFTSHKLQYYPEKIAAVMRGGIPTPIQCEITLTTACNYKCPWCVFRYMRHTRKELLSTQELEQVADDLKILDVKSVIFAGSGEPFFYPHIIKAIRIFHNSGFKLGITTNGSHITIPQMRFVSKHLAWIRFSVNAFTGCRFQEYHGTKKNYIPRIFDVIRELNIIRANTKSSLQIGVQSVLCHPYIDEYCRILTESDLAGADYFMLRPYFPNPNNPPLINKKFIVSDADKKLIHDALKSVPVEHIKVFLREDTEELMQKRTYNLCRALSIVGFALEADGRVFNCFPNRTDNSEFEIGNIREQRLIDIWGGVKHRRFLKEIMPRLNKDECQPYCRHHPGNEYLEELANPTIEGVEFP